MSLESRVVRVSLAGIEVKLPEDVVREVERVRRGAVAAKREEIKKLVLQVLGAGSEEEARGRLREALGLLRKLERVYAAAGLHRYSLAAARMARAVEEFLKKGVADATTLLYALATVKRLRREGLEAAEKLAHSVRRVSALATILSAGSRELDQLRLKAETVLSLYASLPFNPSVSTKLSQLLQELSSVDVEDVVKRARLNARLRLLVASLASILGIGQRQNILETLEEAAKRLREQGRTDLANIIQKIQVRLKEGAVSTSELQKAAEELKQAVEELQKEQQTGEQVQQMQEVDKRAFVEKLVRLAGYFAITVYSNLAKSPVPLRKLYYDAQYKVYEAYFIGARASECMVVNKVVNYNAEVAAKAGFRLNELVDKLMEGDTLDRVLKCIVSNTSRILGSSQSLRNNEIIKLAADVKTLPLAVYKAYEKLVEYLRNNKDVATALTYVRVRGIYAVHPQPRCIYGLTPENIAEEIAATTGAKVCDFEYEGPFLGVYVPLDGVYSVDGDKFYNDYKNLLLNPVGKCSAYNAISGMKVGSGIGPVAVGFELELRPLIPEAAPEAYDLVGAVNDKLLVKTETGGIVRLNTTGSRTWRLQGVKPGERVKVEALNVCGIGYLFLGFVPSGEGKQGSEDWVRFVNRLK